MTKTREPWDKKVGSVIDKIGRVLRSIWDILYKIAQQTIETVNYLVNLIIKLVINPSATIFFCLGLLAFVTIITSFQWWQIGVWVGRLLNMNTLLGWGLGTFGMAGGLFLNIEELAPELHKINKPFAKAYDQMGVKTDLPTVPDESTDANKHRLGNWFSYDFNLAKKGRLVSYAVESGIVLGYVFITGLTLPAVALAFVSLVCPELVIKYLSSKTSLFGTASALANQIESESSSRNFGGSSAPKAPKGGGFDAPGMEVPGGRRDKF